MKIQYCSDLHLEFEKNSRYISNKPLKVKGEILILAGDIIPLHDEFFNNPFFSFISDNYEQVYWVPGNHEFYYKDISDYSESYNISLKSNISLVNNVELIYKNTRFAFSTLWSKISPENVNFIEQGVSDFKFISCNNRKFKALDFNRIHEESLNFIKSVFKTKAQKTVIVTHHLPSNLCNAANHIKSPLNEAFCTDLTDIIESSGVNFWIYGHNHNNKKPVFIGKSILLSNQLGYVHLNEHKNFRHDAFISV